MESGALKNFHVIVKQITKFDGRKAEEFLEWDSKLCVSLSVNNRTIFKILQEQERRLFARPEISQIKTYTAYSSSPQMVQRSPWFEGFRVKHRLREHDTNNRRGQPFAKNSTGVRGRSFGRSTLG